MARCSWTTKFGVYEGNGNDNGPYVELGFRPSILWVKNIDASGDWVIHDNKRDTFNPSDSVLKSNTSGSKDSSTSNYVDFLSNGFKIHNIKANGMVVILTSTVHGQKHHQSTYMVVALTQGN